MTHLPNAIAENDSLQNLEKLTVKELRDLLSSRSLKTSGLKSELIARLRSSDVDVVSPRDTDTPDRSTSPIADHQLDDSSPFEKMTVKELKFRLSRLELPTTGLKNELVERLASVQRGEVQTKGPNVMIIDQITQIPSAGTTSDAVPSSETGPVVDVSRVSTGHDSIEPLYVKSIPSIPLLTSSPVEAIEATEFPMETAMSDIPMELAQPDITTSQSSLDQNLDNEHFEPSKVSPINHLAQATLISGLNERLLATELSTLRLGLGLGLISRSTMREPAEKSQPSPHQIQTDRKTSLQQKPHRLSSKCTFLAITKIRKAHCPA